LMSELAIAVTSIEMFHVSSEPVLFWKLAMSLDGQVDSRLAVSVELVGSPS
jgi:hypothetical protein